jgi:hypothetical protein
MWLGGEEELLAADLAAGGWYLCYLDAATVHHHHHQPSPARDRGLRRRHGIRNTLWFTWLRRPLLWVPRHRRVLPARVKHAFRLVARTQLRTGARRYVS